MKKNHLILGVIFAAFVLVGITGCQKATDTPKETKYYVEGGVLSKSELIAIVSPYENRTDLTFNDIKTVRNTIRNCNMEDFSSEKDVSRGDCHDFLTSHGYTPSEADSIIKSVNDVGNALLFFNVRNSTTKAAYIYAEKQ